MTASNDFGPPRARKVRRHLPSRLSAFLPSSWTTKIQVTVSPHSPPETPLQSLLVPRKTGDNSRPSPSFLEPDYRRRSYDCRRRPPPLTPQSLLTPRSAPQMEVLHETCEASIPAVSVEFVPHHRRSNSTPSSGAWLCSPPSGKRSERPLIVRSSSTKSNERRAKEADSVNHECISVHGAVTTLSLPKESSPRHSLDSDLPPGIYRLKTNMPTRYISLPPTPISVN